ncbi:substrate-binding domain-containing protein [Streptomyces sp. NPDC051211]|uniref:substrate-binding domain-containing protein n=1 Tax=Streptomyces sp. NPDC051211 TaxID=3154643 RepID=UPI003450A0BC
MARFDPRGKVNRALLVGVPAYEYKQPDHPVGVPGDLKAVEHNLTALEHALRKGAVFREDEITVCRPDTVDEFDRRLDEAVDAAEGLLFLYFSGHGAVPSTGDTLWLLMRAATIVPGAESVFRGAAPWKTILTVLARTGAEQVVVVLDCCYAGNAAAAWDALDTRQRRRTSLLMSVQANNRIDAGDDDTPTPFTGQLVRFLTEGVGGPDGEVGFNDLAEHLRSHMLEHHTTLRDPPERWEPQHRPAASGADVLLAAGPAGPAGEAGDAGEAGEEDRDGPPGRGEGQGQGQAQAQRQGQGQGQGHGTGIGNEIGNGLRTGQQPGRRIGRRSGRGPGGGPGRRPGERPGKRPGIRIGPRPAGKTITLAAGALAALVGLIATGFALIGGAPQVCKPALELRLLTDPEIESTVRKAAEAYLVSDANKEGGGCRRSGITVYSAGAADAVAALHDQSDPWQRPTGDDTNPQRDIGPQPDIWIPATSASVARAQAKGNQRRYVELKPDPTPFAYSPMVLAVPQLLATEETDGRVGPLAELTADLRTREQKAEVRRTDPEHSDSGLLATVGLYTSAGASNPAEAERRVAQSGPPSLTGSALLCELPDDKEVDNRTAALVPEFLLKTGVGCDSTTRARRMAAYPEDVPGLDPTYVRVRWQDAGLDAENRDAAAESFHSWLTKRPAEDKENKAGTGGPGLAEFGKDGFRSPEEHQPLDSGLTFSQFGALDNPGRLADSVRPEAMTTALQSYRDAGGPGRVLFLLDSSGSMGDLWEGPGGGPGIIQQSLGGLGDQDQYGVWAVATEPGQRAYYRELLAFGRHGRPEAEGALRQAKVKDMEADPYQALVAALQEMTQRGTDDERPQLIVFITDDEDIGRLTEGGRLNGLLASAREKKIPVVMASLDSGGCDLNKPDLLISQASGGRCLDTKSDLVAGLRDEVARTGTGAGG